MIKPDFNEFEKHCAGANLVPVCRECLADTETPVSVLARFAGDEYVFLLESVEGGGERFGRYSFIGINPRGIFSVENGKAFYADIAGGTRRELAFDKCPLDVLRQIIGSVKPAELPGLPPLFAGAIGFLAYEIAGDFETLPAPKAVLEDPTASLMITDDMIIFDNVRHTLKIVASARPENFPTRRAAYDDAVGRIDRIAEKLKTPAVFSVADAAPAPKPTRLRANMTREEFCERVEKARAYIHAGEAIQIVLSQKFTAPAPATPLQLYRALRLINPSPYTFFLKLGELALVGSSPETMVKLENGKTSLRPIAGTRKRGVTPAADMVLADELLRDPKERAEHLMLVDLGRNDLGRTAQPGSVQVKSFMHVERYSHVMHLVSDVEAELRPGNDAIDLIRSVFPAGTLSGAPKIRAMELIRELEPEPRGVYGGAVGYFSCTGNLDLAITIRTLKVKNGELTVQTGAGIVYDSVPEYEYEETMNKAAAVFNAVRLAGDNLAM